MCGIAGYWGSRTLSAESLEQCLRLMHRRGPDCAGSFQHSVNPQRNLYLLHSRLNIIDFDERANQPFHVGSKVLAYNGELYNYIELKQKLIAEGCQFHTESDTEVLLQTLIRYGWQGLDQCEGMWAFALYDKNDGSLLLSRDRFGEKPLYLYRDETGLYFGSEIKFIVALSSNKLRINYDHLYRYMIHGYRSLYKGTETFFHGIRELSAATVLSVDRDGLEKQWQYWCPVYDPDYSITYQDAVISAREALIRSVGLRLRADVPLAFCLSGGTDSNAIISIAKKVFNHDVHAFTIVSDDKRFDEREMVEYSTKELGIKWTPIYLSTSEFIPNLRIQIKQHDAPVYFVAYYPQWLLMKGIAEQGYRIVVSGAAADELFCGYYDHHIAYLYEVRNDPVLYRQSLENWRENILPIVRNPYWRNPNLYIDNPDFRNHLFSDGEDFRGFLCHEWNEPFMEEKYTSSFLRNRTTNEFFHETTPAVLHDDDLNAMYYSLENRSPFLDRNLFDLLHRVPTNFLIQNGYGKAILRDSIRGIAPEKTLNNYTKTGFNAPIYELLNVNDPDVRSYLLDESPIFDHIRRDKIEALILKPHLPTSESKFLFTFLNSKIFLEEFD